MTRKQIEQKIVELTETMNQSNKELANMKRAELGEEIYRLRLTLVNCKEEKPRRIKNGY